MNPTEQEIKLEKYTNLGYASRVLEEDLVCSLNMETEVSPHIDERSSKTTKTRLPEDVIM